MANEEFDLHLKLLMLGDTGVGKTCLLLRYAHDSFSSMYITTIGIDYKVKLIELEGMKVRLQIWDTAGQERFRTITVSYFKGAHGIMLVYDITDRESFSSITHWITQIKEHADASVNIVLVGNKCDKEDERAVSRQEGQDLADRCGVRFFECSAKESNGVTEAYLQIAKETKDRLLAQEAKNTSKEAIVLVNQPASHDKKKSKCC